MTVTITNHRFRVTGSPQPGRVDITLHNISTMAHEFSFQSLKPGVTFAKVKRALSSQGGSKVDRLLGPDSDARGYGEPAIVGAHSSEEVVTAPVLPAGNYVALSFLPGSDGKPQVFDGLITGFTLRGAVAKAVPTSVAGTVTLTDHGITLPHGFTGNGTYAVTDTGNKPHDFSIASLSTSTSLMDLFGCVEGSFGKGTPIDSCPGTLRGGVNTILPGATAYLTVQLPAGHYGYLSTGGNGKDLKAGLSGTLDIG
jgi:hypothetical protein